MNIIDISENSPLCCGFVMTFTHSSGWIESPNTRKWIGNGFPMKNYVGAVVWKSFQLVIVAEIDQYAKYSFCRDLSKKIQEIIIIIYILNVSLT